MFGKKFTLISPTYMHDDLCAADQLLMVMMKLIIRHATSDKDLGYQCWSAHITSKQDISSLD